MARELVTTDTLRGWALPAAGSDKESRGRIVVVGGSRETPGAVLLAGEAALRSGGGKLQLATVRSVVGPLAVAVPESRVIGLAESDTGVLAPEAAEDVLAAAGEAAVVLLGPGLVDVEAGVRLLEQVVPRLDTRVVVDALASAYVTRHSEGLAHLAGRCVLAVNPGELALVMAEDEDAVAEDLEGATVSAASRTGVVVLCGGSTKVVATPDGGCWVVGAGGPGLGVSGSGDVQAGIVAGLMARGATPEQAAVWAAELHGRAGDRLARAEGPLGFLARELPGQLPALLAELG